MTQEEDKETQVLGATVAQEVYRFQLGVVSAIVLLRSPDVYAVSLWLDGKPLCVLKCCEAARMLEALDGCLDLVEALETGETVDAWKAHSEQDAWLFSPGEVVLTPGAAKVLTRAGVSPTSLLYRHLCGDWGSVSAEDCMENERSLREGLRLLSVYPVSGSEDSVWIITEGDRTVTTLRLPCEY